MLFSEAFVDRTATVPANEPDLVFVPFVAAHGGWIEGFSCGYRSVVDVAPIVAAAVPNACSAADYSSTGCA